MKKIIDKMFEAGLINSKILSDSKEIPTDKIISFVKDYARELQEEQIKADAYYAASYIKLHLRNLKRETDKDNAYVNEDAEYLLGSIKVNIN